jgi:DNA polymerase
MIILTDMPSPDDDVSGKILTGVAGEMMDKMLNAIGMSRDVVSILPMLFWRTPGGRSPSRDEIDLARPFVNRAIELLKPRVILTLGTLPATEIAGINRGRSHGIATTIENNITVMPIYHPNYLILKPAAKRDVWNALQNVQNLLKSA